VHLTKWAAEDVIRLTITWCK